MYNAEMFMEDVFTQPKQQKFKLGVIDENYTSGNPKVKLDGETSLSSATYKYLSSYSPQANDRVLLVDVNGYIILGKIV